MFNVSNSFNKLQDYKNEFNSNINKFNHLQNQWTDLKKELKKYDNTVTKRHVTYENKESIRKLKKDIKRQLRTIKKIIKEKKLNKDNNMQQYVKLLNTLKNNVNKYDKKYAIIDYNLTEQQKASINKNDYEKPESVVLPEETVKGQNSKKTRNKEEENYYEVIPIQHL